VTIHELGQSRTTVPMRFQGDIVAEKGQIYGPGVQND
jgi:hypothetical protein